MNIETMKTEVNQYRSGLSSSIGALVQFSESGPISMTVIDILISYMEIQDKRIAELEKKIR